VRHARLCLLADDDGGNSGLAEPVEHQAAMRWQVVIRGDFARSPSTAKALATAAKGIGGKDEQQKNREHSQEISM
jgi:hypothetical protein